MSKIHASDWLLAALVLFYSLNLGPMIFESFTSDRIWASNPPQSFYMFLGEYGQRTAHYWRIVSPLALASFILSLVFNWNVPDRKLWLSAAFILYLAIQAATMAYFVPEQEGLISAADSVPGNVLKSRADRWILLNYFRVGTGVLAFLLLVRAIFVPRMP